MTRIPHWGWLWCFTLTLASCGQSDVGQSRPGPAHAGSPEEEVGTTSQALNSVNIWADPSASQTITQPSGTSLTLKATVNGVINVSQFVTGGSGTSSSPWTGWESGLNSAMSGATVAGEVYFPKGYWKQTATIQLPAAGTFTGHVTGPIGWTVRGAGVNGTILYASNGAIDGIQSISNYNASTAVRLVLENFAIACGSVVSGSFQACASPTGAGIDVVGGSFVTVRNVAVSLFKHGIILDQAELADVEGCDIELNSGAGVWLVNGNEHQAAGVTGVPGTPTAAGGYTNRIGIRTTQFNTNGFGIADDGGYTHVLETNNFTAGATAIHLAGVIAGRITGSEFESQTSDQIVSGDHTAQGNNSGTGPNDQVTIADNVLASGTHAAIKFVTSGGPFYLANNFMSSSVPAVSGTANIYLLNADGNANAGTGGIFDANPTLGLFGTPYGVGVGISTPSAALDVKGGVRLNTAAGAPTCSASIRGEFWFSQGGAGVADVAQVCAKDSAGAYAWHALY